LPEKTILLASSKKCGIEAYRIKNNIYGIQFHPELDKKGMKTRLELFPSYTKGKKIGEILSDYQPTPFAAKVIKNFIELSKCG
jgi:GMP synthase-like glutamine amidotransferase